MNTRDKHIPMLVRVNLPVQISADENGFVAYCPALDLSTYGESEEAVKRAFEEVLQIFIGETDRKGTLERELVRLGWSLIHGLHPRYRPPASRVSDRQSTSIHSIHHSYAAFPFPR